MDDEYDVDFLAEEDTDSKIDLNHATNADDNSNANGGGVSLEDTDLDSVVNETEAGWLSEEHASEMQLGGNKLQGQLTEDSDELKRDDEPAMATSVDTEIGGQLMDAPSEKPQVLQTTSGDDELYEPTDRKPESDMTEEDVQKLTNLLTTISEDPYNYGAHVAYIALLRRAGMHDELSQARETMHQIFPLNESLWMEWLNDDVSIAHTVEQKVELEGIFKTAMRDYLSVRLWKQYVEYMVAQLLSARAGSETAEHVAYFTYERVVAVFDSALSAVGLVLPSSHEIWDIYRDLLTAEMETNQSEENYVQLKRAYVDRIKTPHLNIEKTWEDFSSLISSYDATNYEANMVYAMKYYSKSKQLTESREPFELALPQSSQLSSDYLTYLQWESSQKPLQVDLLRTLYERLLALFPLTSEIWLDYLHFVFEHDRTKLGDVHERAVRNCPESGRLWNEYLRHSEILNHETDEVLELRDRALGAPLQKNASSSVQVHLGWCGYLKRRLLSRLASADATEDELGPEVEYVLDAVREAIKLLRKRFKTDSAVDPLEYLLIDIHTALGELDMSRNIWGQLAKHHYRDSSFFRRFFEWERLHGDSESARNVLKRILFRTMDDSDQILDLYLMFENEVGTALSIQQATVDVHKARKILRAAGDANVPIPGNKAGRVPEESQDRKRKPDLEEIQSPTKRSKAQEHTRSRETSCVILRDLDQGITEIKLRQFFRNCGTINRVEFATAAGSGPGKVVALIEFGSRDEMLTALTRDAKYLEGMPIHVESGEGTRLYVTNFPATADEAALREKFEEFDTVLSVDFPSLAFNKSRRFCYVQMLSSEAAQKCLSLDGKEWDGNDDTRLVVKLSDPSQRHERSGAIHEGRELIVSNIDWKANETQIQEIFEKYGHVESVRLPRNPTGQSKGFGFVVFAQKEDADRALELDKTKFMSRILNVGVAEYRHGHAPKATFGRRTSSLEGGNRPRPSFLEIKEKTLGVMNLSDTVNEARLMELFESFGELRKVELRPDHGGAVVEFEAPVNAGKASLELEGFELALKRIHIGSLEELMKCPRPDQPIAPILPPQVATRRNRRSCIDIGNRSAVKPTTSQPGVKTAEANGSSSGGKDNDAFRKLYLQGNKGTE